MPSLRRACALRCEGPARLYPGKYLLDTLLVELLLHVDHAHPHQFLRGVAKDLAGHLIDIDEPALFVEYEEGIGSLLDQHTESLLALAQCLFSLLALRKIPRDAVVQ